MIQIQARLPRKLARSSVRHLTALAVVLLACLALGAPAFANQSETALLESYIGNWRGTGTLSGGDQPETFRCRLTVAGGNQAKINYAGRCSVGGLNLAVNGTIAYNDVTQRYEAAMTSNTRFSGMVVGVRRGNSILFDLRQRRTGNTNSKDEIEIGSKILLKEGKITVEFELTFTDSGRKMSTTVPFSR